MKQVVFVSIVLATVQCVASKTIIDKETLETLIGKMKASPKLLTEWKCPVNDGDEDWGPRCFKAEYYYTILGAFYYHGGKCTTATHAQAATQKIEKMCGDTPAAKAKCIPEIRVSTHQDFSYHDFKERADLWEMEKHSDEHGWVSWKAKGDLKVRKVEDDHSLPHRCGFLMTDIDKRFSEPGRKGNISFALPLILPDCPGKPTTKLAFDDKKHTGPVKKAIQCVPAELKCGDNQDTHWCSLILYTVPVIALDKEGTKKSCWKDSELFSTECKLVDNRNKLHELMASYSNLIAEASSTYPLLTIQKAPADRSYVTPTPANYRCAMAEWFYSVVSAQLICPSACQDAHTKKCNTATLNSICGTGGCKITVRVMNKESWATNKRSIGYRTPWHLLWTGASGMNVQIRESNEITAFDVHQSEPSELYCSRILVEALNRKEHFDRRLMWIIQPKYDEENPVTTNLQTVEIPMPWWDAQAQKMPAFFNFTKDLDVGRKCGTSADAKIKLRVNFLVGQYSVADRHAFWAIPPDPNYLRTAQVKQKAKNHLDTMLGRPDWVGTVHLARDKAQHHMSPEEKIEAMAVLEKWEKVHAEQEKAKAFEEALADESELYILP